MTALDVTDMEDPGDANLTVTCYAADGTVLGSRTGGGAYVDGAELAVAQQYYLKFAAAGGAVTLNTFGPVYTVTHDGGTTSCDIDNSETIADGKYKIYYFSSTGSSYYDSALKYGGERDTETGTAAAPYRTITAALAALGGAFTIVTVLDSETYDEELTISGAYTLQAALGQTPTITSGIGARVTREVAHDGNDSDTAYVSKLGDDGNAGTWLEPYLTIGAAITGIGARTFINIKDNGDYNESITLPASTTIEPIYGKLPTMNHTTNVWPNGVINRGNDSNVYGLTLNLPVVNHGIHGVANGGIIKDNTISNVSYGIFCESTTSITIKNNIIYNSTNGCIVMVVSNTSGEISKNILHDCPYYGIYFGTNGAGVTCSIDIIKNTLYSNQHGIQVGASAFTYSGDIDNNVFYNNSEGINIGNITACTGTINKNIFRSNTTVAINSEENITLNYNCFYGNTVQFSGAGVKTNNNEITTDPLFMSLTSPYNFALKIGSPCYKLDGSENDVGLVLGNILISSSTVTINGFIIDGQSKYNNAIYKTGATDYTALTVKWCTIHDYQGIAIDDYSGANTTSTISNNKIYDNGNGIKFTYGGNTCSYNIIYNNTIYGIYSDRTVQTFDHNVFYLNQYGIYLYTNSSGIIVTNSIFISNTLYGIYSNVTVSISYCDITDAYNSNVIISPYSTYHNITDNPLLMSIVPGSEDFNIKTIYAGYILNSPCMNTADDGYDIGAYLISRSINSDGWKEHRFTYNPRIVDESYIGIDVSRFESAQGNIDSFAKAHKRVFALKFGNMQYMNETDRKRMFYFLSDITTKQNDLTNEQTRLRLHFLPSQKEETGTAGVVSATAKTLTDTSQTWVEDEHKGFWCSVKAVSGSTNMSIVGATKVCTVAAAGWTVDAWIGYYLCIYTNSKVHYLYITDNDATTITVSDPNGYVDNQTNISWSIVKNYRILSNTSTALTLEDDYAELIAGSSIAYHIDFIVCRIASNSIAYAQPRFYRQQETWKCGSELTLQEE